MEKIFNRKLRPFINGLTIELFTNQEREENGDYYVCGYTAEVSLCGDCAKLQAENISDLAFKLGVVLESLVESQNMREA